MLIEEVKLTVQFVFPLLMSCDEIKKTALDRVERGCSGWGSDRSITCYNPSTSWLNPSHCKMHTCPFSTVSCEYAFQHGSWALSCSLGISGSCGNHCVRSRRKENWIMKHFLHFSDVVIAWCFEVFDVLEKLCHLFYLSLWSRSSYAASWSAALLFWQCLLWSQCDTAALRVISVFLVWLLQSVSSKVPGMSKFFVSSLPQHVVL